jgi:hypothetical protein
MSGDNHHADDCLLRRYLALPEEDQDWFPSELGGVPDLCTCGANPGSNALRPEVRDLVEEMRVRLDHHHGQHADAIPAELVGFDLAAASGGKRTVLYLADDVLEYLAQPPRAAAARGYRLTRSAIVNQLVRRHRDGGG